MPDDDIQKSPVIKSGRTRQKPVESEVAAGVKTARYRCIRQRQYRGRIIYPDDSCILPDPLPKGFEEYFEKTGEAREAE